MSIGPAAAHLPVVTREIDHLAANMLLGVASATLINMLAMREAEKARLEGLLATRTTTRPVVTILPHPALLQLFEKKVGVLRDALDQEMVRGDAAAILYKLICRVTIYPDGENRPKAEVVAKTGDLMAFTTNDDAAPRDGVYSSIAVVAGTRNTRCLRSSKVSFRSLVERTVPRFGGVGLSSLVRLRS